MANPAGLSVGDLFFIFVHFYDQGQTFTVPAGYTVAAGISAFSYSLTGIWKIATSADVIAGSVFIGFTAQTYGDTIGIRVTGFDPLNPVDSTNTASQSGVFIWTSSNSVTPSKANSTILFSYGCNGSVNSGMGNSGDTAFGTPQGTVTGLQNWVQSSPVFTSGTAVYDYRTTTASTNGFTVNPASNFADWVGTLIVINPATSGSTANSNFFELM